MNPAMGRWLAVATLMAWGTAAAQGAAQPVEQAAPRIALIEIEGPIGPATSGYFEKAQRHALDRGAGAIVLRLDTPGGLDGAMRDIIKGILNSPVPVIGFVAPGGSRAASAGTYILYACHVAAMAPATNLGAATPVPIAPTAMPGGGKPEDKQKEGKKKGDEDAGGDEDEAPDAGTAMQHKIVNDAVAYIRSLAEKRGRNADWAEQAVRKGVSLSAEQALKEHVVDLMANDVPDLLNKIDGRKVATQSGELVLHTASAGVERIEPDWRAEFLAVLTNPTVAYILMLIGIYGLLLEGYHPGAVLPGVAGAICLLLALFAFQVLPVNFVGLGLILLGVVLMIAEALVPSFGALGFGGIAAFVIGSIMLMDIDVPGYGVNLGVIAGIAVTGALVLATTLYLLWRARRAPVVTGTQGLVGREGVVIEPGWARVGGEIWRVRCEDSSKAGPLQAGQAVRVVGMEGLTLTVQPKTH